MGILGVDLIGSPLRRRAAVLALSCAAGVPAGAADCTTPRLLLERYISADCQACWQAMPPAPPPAQGGATFVLDWIVPGARGADAPLAAAAVPEATARAARAGGLRSDEALTQGTPLAARSALQLKVQDGPAWKGYIGVQMQAHYGATRPLPAGLAGYLAVVERIAAGEDGSPVARQLVRAVVGPLPLDGLAEGRKVDHLRATRLPDTAKPERLSVVGWLETPAGRVLAIAGRDDPQCQRTP
jgi:hypothetical protein